MNKLNLLKEIKKMSRHFNKNVGRAFYGRTPEQKADIDYLVMCKERARERNRASKYIAPGKSFSRLKRGI